MHNLDLTSLRGLLGTVLGILLFTLIGVGIRVLMMLTLQQRQQRANRQINERLRTLMSAYRTLGGSFTGQLTVDPTHLRDQRLRAQQEADQDAELAAGAAAPNGSDRTRRMRDAVEAALADIILLGTEEQVRLAGTAARDMAEGRPIHTAELVISLRDFIRKALDLEPVPEDVKIPLQGPTRPAGGSGGKGEGGGSGGGGAGGGGMGAGMGGGGMGMGMGLRRADDET